MKEYYNSQVKLKKDIGPQFTSTLVSNNDYEESHDIFNFLDYYPLVNSRAHRIGGMDETSTSSSKETK